MSVENFFYYYEPASFVQAIQNHERFVWPYKAASVGRIMAEEGGSGVRQVARVYARGIGPSREDLLQRTSVNDRQELYENLAAIHFGVNLEAIERMLIEREFAKGDYLSMLDEMLTGTPFKSGYERGFATQRLGGEEWRRMVDVAKGDKTLSDFFHAKIGALPPFFRMYVAEPGGIPGLFSETSNYILPKYKERMIRFVSTTQSLE